MNSISELFGLRRRAFKRDNSRWQELIGVELELEGVDSPSDIPYWERKSDNSLRNGVEYVLDQPYAGPTLDHALDAYYDQEMQANNTQRTSTHIHINMTDATVDNVRNMTMIMYMIEDALFNVIGEGRKWAGYSMALSEMDPVRMRIGLASADYAVACSHLAPARNQERYYGFNTASLRRHGTVEFRYFPGGPTRPELENWLDLVVAVKAAAVSMATPEALISRLATPEDVTQFLSSYFSDYWIGALLRQTPPEYMLYKFNTVAALACDPELVEHRDNVLFLTPTFVKYIKAKFLEDAGRRYFDELIKEVSVISASEWYTYLSLARAKDNAPPTKAPKSKKSVALEEVYRAQARTSATISPSESFLRFSDLSPSLADPFAEGAVPTNQPTRRTR